MMPAIRPERTQPPAGLLEREDTLRIVLVRHGETFQNREHVVQGQDPTFGRLTEKGIAQARVLGEALTGQPFDIAYCSPLERAVLTMSLILVPRRGERTLPLVFAEELREIHLGHLHGRPHTEWKAGMDGHDPMSFRPAGGENWLDVQGRVTRYFREAILANGHGTVLVVAHGGVNRGLIASLTGLTMGETWQGAGVGAPQDNTCVNDLVVDRQGNLLWALVNDSSHLLDTFEGASHGQLWHPREKRWELVGVQPDPARRAKFIPLG